MQSTPRTVLDSLKTTSLEPTSGFDFDPRTRVIYGSGVLQRLGELCRELGGKVLLITDHGLARAGHASRAVEILDAVGLPVTVFDEVTPNPTTLDVDRALEVARHAEIDVIVGLGGGSSMDCAKGVNFLFTNGGRMEDYRGVGKASKSMLPMIAIPTTAGTGSEAQSYALIADPATHMKMACGDKKAACRVAVLDPDLSLSMPARVTAATGIDAISHAIESFVTTRRNPVSQLFSRQAWRLLSRAFPAVLQSPDLLEARGAMLLGAHLAGAAIENSMLGATHSLANPLTAGYGLEHGIAIGVMLPHVVRYNAPAVGHLYGQLAREAGLCDEDHPRAPHRLADYLTSLVAMAGLPISLSACDVDAERLDELSSQAASQWTAQFNPRPVDAGRLKEIYECALPISDIQA